MLTRMGAPAGSLAAAIADADSQVTVLDDRVDAEEHAEWLWLKAHVLNGFAGHRVVVGTENLTLSWHDKTTKFNKQEAAELYLRHFAKNRAAMTSLRKVAMEARSGAPNLRSDDDVLKAVASGLLVSRIWLVELPKRAPKSRFITKTDPKAFAPINPKYGTKIDFAYIAKLEGDQWLRGYVPFKGKTGVVAGRSGMTVASGFDLGQWRKEELEALHFPPKLLAKILLFAYPLNFRALKKQQVAEKVGKTAPVPELEKTEADLCDGAVFNKKLGDAMDQWNNNRGPGVPKYTDLPGGWQTVWLSRVYQGQLGKFGPLALSGQWQAAVTSLKTGEYAKRTKQEATLLEAELPAPIKETTNGGKK